MKNKKIIMMLCSVFLTPLSVYGTWARQNSGTTLDLKAVFFIDSLYGWAAGGENNSGIVLRTTNGGTTWVTAYTDTKSVFYSIWFINRQTGWVVGGRDNYTVIDTSCQKILKTTDGGLSWRRQFNTNSNTNWRACYGVCFIGNTGWATVTGWADSFGYIIYTTDGGTTWVNQRINASAAIPWDIHFVTTSIGVVSGGINWGYPGDNTDGHIWRTTDGGRNWTSVHNWRPGTAAMGFLTSIWMVDLNNGWSVGGAGGMSVREPGRIVTTTNGGLSWFTRNPTSLRPFWGVYFPEALWGWVGDYYNGILLTTDGGVNWLDDNAGATSIYDIHGTNRRNAWAVGANGLILRYSPASGIESEKLLVVDHQAPIKITIEPNPFKVKTVINFEVGLINGCWGAGIYDINGRQVRSFNRIPDKNQRITITWDGKDDMGRQLPTGIYYVQIEGREYRVSKSVILLN